MRFVGTLRCPFCGSRLDVLPFTRISAQLSKQTLLEAEQRGILSRDLSEFIEDGLLLCHDCKLMFPVTRGLPILLPYATEVHKAFEADFKSEILKLGLSYAF